MCSEALAEPPDVVLVGMVRRAGVRLSIDADDLVFESPSLACIKPFGHSGLRR